MSGLLHFSKGKASERHAITEANTKITETVTDQIIQQIEVPSVYVQIAVGKHLEKIIGEQINLDKISAIAANELTEDKLNSSANQSINESNEGRSIDSTNQDANNSGEKVIDDVWLNIFETEARPHTTEDMQLLFGRILAGEIKQPGSYSIRTIKKLVELNQDAAVLFKKLCSLCIVVENPYDGVIIDARVVSQEGNAAHNALRKYGLSFDQLNVLNEYGLIIPDYNSSHGYTVISENKNNLQFLLLQHQEQYWNLLPVPDHVEKQDIRLSGVAFSLLGRELFRIIDQEPEEEYTKDLQKYLERQNVQMTEIPIQ